jgi:hypothetical protein
MAKKQSKHKEAETSRPFVASSVPGITLPEGTRIKRHVTLPSLAIKADGQQELLFIVDEMRVSKITQKADEKKPREPATICTAIKVDTGETVTFIVPAVVKANLLRDYAKLDDAGNVKSQTYVGKAFAIQNKGKRTESQRYNDFAIYELELTEEQQAQFGAAMGGGQ